MKNKLRIGVIGAGSFSQKHLEGIKGVQNAEAVAICDINIELAKAQAQKFHIESVYSDYRELLAREDIDAVTLPVPDQVHKEIQLLRCVRESMFCVKNPWRWIWMSVRKWFMSRKKPESN